jgi:hypothetical protein
MFKKLVKDFLRDIVRTFNAWLNTTDNGRAFKSRFKQGLLESAARLKKKGLQ